MGNNASQSNHAEALDSRVIKISESVAQRLIVQRESAGRLLTIEAPKTDSPKKPFRRDPGVIGEDVYQEFEKQDVINELQMKSLGQKLSKASKGFSQKPIADLNSGKEPTDEQQKVQGCFKSNNGAVLNCHAQVVDFVGFVENNTYPAVSAQ